MKSSLATIIIALFAIICGLDDETVAEDKSVSESVSVMSIDFTDYSGESVVDWLGGKGFRCQKDACYPGKIDLEAGNAGLAIRTKKPAFGMIMNQGIDIREYCTIRITWGIRQYPVNASWEYKRKNEVISVMVFFGYEKIDSGSIFIPNTPYFLALFLGPDEIPGKGYTARYFKQSGRWVCLGNPLPGNTITSEFEILQAYRKHFHKTDKPVISAVAISTDTANSGNNGKAEAYIQTIQFFK